MARVFAGMLVALPVVSVLAVLLVCFAFAIFLSLRLFQFELARIRAEE